jgi:Na+/H+ antiporter NhaD/arsenite permease-like protein
MHMEWILLSIFVLGYLFISIEHVTKVDKLIPALLMMALSWMVVAINMDGITLWFNSELHSLESITTKTPELKQHLLSETLLHHFGKTAEILIFLMGAMTIVEMIDHFDGFSNIKKWIKTTNKRRLLWIVCGLGFLLSAVIDNLTATIVLITLLRKMVPDNNLRMWYAGMVVIAANAGGAWTPIGDVTTTMLWMEGKVSTVQLMTYLAIPSLLCVLVPLLVARFLPIFRGEFEQFNNENSTKKPYSTFMLVLGLLLILSVPVFKSLTHLPPYMGMMLALSVFALVAEIVSKGLIQLTFGGEAEEQGHHGPTLRALSNIEIPSILFFLGILMTVAAMESLGMIFQFGQGVQQVMPQELFVTLLGLGSAVVDNVPLVAASMGMYDLPLDAPVWHYIAFSAGTGGSVLVIGSAAGVVAMGMEKMSFSWYLKNISGLALLGFASGMAYLILFF